MRKLFTNKNKKGFAMAELLAVSIVLLFIFSILFSNYLPLLAEYETRLSYNDVTAQYAAHYIRKMYMEALKDEGIQSQFNDVKKGDVGYKTVYKSGSNTDIYNHIAAVTNSNVSWANDAEKKAKKKEIENIITEYGIEEIIITKYKLKGNKDATETTKYVKDEDGYKKDAGYLYNYINYLPNYEKSIYTGNIEKEEGEQLYRLILKTKDFGYATTPILFDYKTPSSCFEGKSNGDGTLTITKYLYNEENGCGKTVIIKNTPVTIKGISGKITAIGDGVFQAKDDGSNPASQVKNVILPEKNGVKSIGKSAFEGSSLESIYNLDRVSKIGELAFANSGLKKVELTELTADNIEIGNYAFANTQIHEIDLTNYPPNGTIGDYAFSSNKNLTTVKFSQSIDSSAGIIVGNYAFANNKELETVSLPNVNIYSTGTTLSVGLFERSGTDTTNGISGTDTTNGTGVTITNGMTDIGEEMFYLAKISGITLNDGVQTIGDRAFSQYNNTNKEGTGKADNVTITANVESIGADSFRGLNITTLTFNDGDVPLSIGVAAFKQNAIGYLEIPSRVNSIGANAFENSGIQTLTFDSNGKITSISKQAFYNNNINKPLVIPENVKSIGTQAFSENNSLSDLTLPSKLETIGSSAFSHTALTNITIPESVTSIGGSAFKDSKLENVEIVDGEKSLSLQNAVFQGNKSLKEFAIPSRVSFIGDNIFSGIGEDAKILNKSSSLKDIDWCSKFALNINCHTEVDQNDENKLTIIYEDEVDSAIKYTRYVYNMGGVTNE